MDIDRAVAQHIVAAAPHPCPQIAVFCGVGGVEAQSEFGDDRKRKNDFFEAVGALPPLGASTAESLEERGIERAFSVIRDSVKAGNWAL